MRPTPKPVALKQPTNGPARQAYDRPRLKLLGDLRSLTQAASSGLMEGGMSPGMSGMRA